MARLTELQDADLVRAFKQGDRRAFDELYRRHRHAVELVCRRRLRDPGAVEECVQETFLRAYKTLPRFEGGERILNWLRTTAKCVAIDEMRRTARRDLVVDPVRVASTADQPPTVDDMSELDAYLALLPPRDATLLVAHHVHDVDVRTLAEAHGMTVGSMGVAIHRARSRLRTLVRNGRRRVAALAPVSFMSRIAGQLKAHQLRSTAAFSWPSWEAILATASSGLAATLLVALVTITEPPTQTLPRDGAAASSTETAELEDQAPVEQSHSNPRPASAGDRTSTHRDMAPAQNEPRPRGLVTQGETYAVDVPGTDRRVTNESPAGDPDFSYGVRVNVGGHDVGFGMETWDEPEQRPVHETACTVSRLGRPVSHCEEPGGRTAG